MTASTIAVVLAACYSPVGLAGASSDGNMLESIPDIVSLLQTSQDMEGAEVDVQEPSDDDQAINLGLEVCQCIGLHNYSGETKVKSQNSTLVFPADVGSVCKAWDAEAHPDCNGADSPAWCSEQWCFIDPCSCDVAVPPKVSSYFPSAKNQGKPVFFSYVTCGSTDKWTEDNYEDACVNQKTSKECIALGDKCSWSLSKGCVGAELSGVQCGVKRHIDEDVWGKDECKCIGVNNRKGVAEADVLGKTIEYPVDVGSACATWDKGVHPKCLSDDAPDWCESLWCYVDPCSCGVAIPPKTNTYFPGASYQDKPVYYSYITCGNLDTYTETERANSSIDACVNQDNEEDCVALGDGKKCLWNEGENRFGWQGCMGSELATRCANLKGPSAEKAGGGSAALAPLAVFAITFLH